MHLRLCRVATVTISKERRGLHTHGLSLVYEEAGKTNALVEVYICRKCGRLCTEVEVRREDRAERKQDMGEGLMDVRRSQGALGKKAWIVPPLV